MKKFFVSELYPHALFTAGILREDIETVLQKSGYQTLHIDNQDGSITARIGSYVKAGMALRELPPGSLVFFHFPLRSRVIRNFFDRVTQQGSHTIAYVHDFEGLRDGDSRLLQKELKQLGAFAIILAQNETMQAWIRKQTGNQQVISIESYDYLLEEIPGGHRHKSFEIAFAGNLLKAPFIELLEQVPELHFHIYGQEGNSKINVTRHGQVHPRRLPAIMKGSFGLVWDGDSIDTCSGGPGTYLRINTSHKLALHIMAGLPVILWEEDAMASWVLENEIGFTVSSLKDIYKKIEEMQDEVYNHMLQKQKSLQTQMAAGNYLQAALQKTEVLIS
jgi:hypothetical protein